MTTQYQSQQQTATVERLLRELHAVLGSSIQVLLVANPLAQPEPPPLVATPPVPTPIAPPTVSEDNIPLRVYSVKQAAQTLGMSISCVRRLIQRGLLRPSRAMRHLRIPVKQIDELLKNTSE